MLRLTQQEYDDLQHNTATPITNTRKQSAAHSHRLGQSFEHLIENGCQWYERHGEAMINKCPEPFIVTSRTRDGRFIGRFTNKKAQPDFQGTVKGGRAFVAEAKATDTDRLQHSRVTKTQAELLDKHAEMGAYCCILGMIQTQIFVIPWEVWKNMKSIYGRKYVTSSDLSQYRLPDKDRRNPCPFLYYYQLTLSEQTSSA